MQSTAATILVSIFNNPYISNNNDFYISVIICFYMVELDLPIYLIETSR